MMIIEDIEKRLTALDAELAKVEAALVQQQEQINYLQSKFGNGKQEQ
jgi:uncharacterized coiled-coil protein SlyX